MSLLFFFWFLGVLLWVAVVLLWLVLLAGLLLVRLLSSSIATRRRPIPTPTRR
jgi:hypothetical protein